MYILNQEDLEVTLTLSAPLGQRERCSGTSTLSHNLEARWRWLIITLPSLYPREWTKVFIEVDAGFELRSVQLVA